MAKEIPEELFVGYVGQKVLLEKNEKLLMCQGVGKGDPWDFPGGRLHKDEELEAGLLREVHEELGIKIKRGELFGVYAHHNSRGGAPKLLVVYRGDFIDNPSNIVCAKDEIYAVQWVGKEDVEKIETHPIWRDVLRKYFELT